jgi:uncharacterized protein (DUF983 family)
VPPQVSLTTAIGRGLRKRCPRCGVGGLYESFYTLKERCDHCALPLRVHEDDCYAFMYVSTGFITGVFLIAFFFFTPANIVLGQVIVALLAVAIMWLTMPQRKGVALALNFLIDQASFT